MLESKNLTARPSAKKHTADGFSPSHGVEIDGNRETDSFIALAPAVERDFHIGGIALPRGLKPVLVAVVKAGANVYVVIEAAVKKVSVAVTSNPVYVFTRRQVEAVFSFILSYTMPFCELIPEDSAIHIFTCILVIAGVLTLFISPAFRSKLSEMRVRPVNIQNGIIDAMAVASDKYNILRDDLREPRETCTESHFRCEYYWTSDTNEATDTQTTYYCTAYVCQGMTVRVHTLPQSCSGSNRVGIGALLKDIYGKPVYSCGNTGCGECSSLRYSNLEDGPVSFLQGCDEEDSCYGQIEVSITWDDGPVTAMKEPLRKAPWSRFRGGPFNQGISRAAGVGGRVDPEHPPEPSAQWQFDIDGAGVRSSPIISGGMIAYVGADDHNVYAINAGELSPPPGDGGESAESLFRKKRERTSTPGNVLWKYSTRGKVSSSPALSPDDKVLFVGSDDHNMYALDAASGELMWEFETGGEITSSPVLGVSDPPHEGEYSPVGKVYFGSWDGNLYALTGAGSKVWRFSTAAVDETTGWVVAASAVSSSPAVVNDGQSTTVYVGAESGFIFAVSDAGGAMKWRFKTDGAIYSSPVVSSDGLSVYVGSADFHLYAVSHTGVLKWRFYTGGVVRATAALYSHALYFTTTSADGEESMRLAALGLTGSEGGSGSGGGSGGVGGGEAKEGGAVSPDSGSSGSEESASTSTSTSASSTSSSSSSSSGEDAAEESDEKRHRHHHHRRRRLHSRALIGNTTAPTAGTAGVAEVKEVVKKPSKDSYGHLYALNVHGELLWKQVIDRGSSSSPLVDLEGTLYVGSEDSFLYAFTTAGSAVWKYEVPGDALRLSSSPGMDSEGLLYVGTVPKKGGMGRLIAVDPNIGPAAGAVKEEKEKVENDKEALWLCSAESSNPDRDEVITSDDVCALAEEELSQEDGKEVRHRRRLRASEHRRRLRVEGVEGGVERGHFGGEGVEVNGMDGDGQSTHHTHHTHHQRELRKKKKDDDGDEDDDRKKSREKKIKTKAMKAAPKIPTHTCLPGFNTYVGKGVDMSYNKHDPDFIRGRVLEFSELKRIVNMHGTDHLAPLKEELSVRFFENTLESDPHLTGLYNGISDYTSRLSKTINTTTMLNTYSSTDKMPSITITSIMTNGTGFYTSPTDFGSKAAPPVAVSINANAVAGRASFVNVASFTHAEYKYLPKKDGKGQLCAKGFMNEVASLPVAYSGAAYHSLIRRYGTHIVIGVTIGGYITSVMPYDPCQLAGSDYTTTEKALEGYKEEVGEFTVYRKFPSMTFLGQNISRLTMNICGGKAAIFTSESRSPFESWTKAAMKDKTRPCAVYVDVIPLYAVLPPSNPIRAQLASAVFEHIYKVRHNVAFHTTPASLTCAPVSAPVGVDKKEVKIDKTKAPPRGRERERERERRARRHR